MRGSSEHCIVGKIFCERVCHKLKHKSEGTTSTTETLQRIYSFPLKGLWKSFSGIYAEELAWYVIVDLHFLGSTTTLKNN